MLDLPAKERPLSDDYLNTKQQFQLHSLITEQRHPKTWNLSQTLAASNEEGLKQLLSVDEDISVKFQSIVQDEPLMANLHQAATAIQEAIETKGRKIYIYGCGSTGRLAKQIESETWKQFWARIEAQHSSVWNKVVEHFGEGMKDKVIGELTGGDRALVNALEGFEDL